MHITRSRIELVCLVIGLLSLAAILWHLFGLWVWQPLMLIGFSILGTQFGAQFGRTILINLARRLTATGTASEASADSSLPENELLKVIKDRAEQAGTPAGIALNSYLSQVVGAFSMVILIIGVCIILMCHKILGVSRPDWAFPAAGGALVVVIMLLVWLLLKEPLHSTTIRPYYNWTGFFPPRSPLTFFRITVVVIYSLLVFTLYYQRPNQNQKPQSMSLPVEKHVDVPTKPE
jgi:hypothetical protein